MRAITLGVGSTSWPNAETPEQHKDQLRMAMDLARTYAYDYPSRFVVICENGLTCFDPTKTSAYLQKIGAKFYT